MKCSQAEVPQTYSSGYMTFYANISLCVFREQNFLLWDMVVVVSQPTLDFLRASLSRMTHRDRLREVKDLQWALVGAPQTWVRLALCQFALHLPDPTPAWQGVAPWMLMSCFWPRATGYLFIYLYVCLFGECEFILPFCKALGDCVFFFFYIIALQLCRISYLFYFTQQHNFRWNYSYSRAVPLINIVFIPPSVVPQTNSIWAHHWLLQVTHIPMYLTRKKKLYSLHSRRLGRKGWEERNVQAGLLWRATFVWSLALVCDILLLLWLKGKSIHMPPGNLGRSKLRSDMWEMRGFQRVKICPISSWRVGCRSGKRKARASVRKTEGKDQDLERCCQDHQHRVDF